MLVLNIKIFWRPIESNMNLDSALNIRQSFAVLYLKFLKMTLLGRN